MKILEYALIAYLAISAVTSSIPIIGIATIENEAIQKKLDTAWNIVFPIFILSSAILVVIKYLNV